MNISVNGFSTEDDSRSGHDQICSLIDDGERCTRQAGNASYSKRIQKTVQQKKLKLTRDDCVIFKLIFFLLKLFSFNLWINHKIILTS